MDQKVKEYAGLLDVPVQELTGNSRKAEINDKRHIIWYLLRKINGFRTDDIRIYFNRKQCETVMHGVNRILILLDIKDKKLLHAITQHNLTQFFPELLHPTL